MTLHYRFDPEDVGAFNQWYLRHSKEGTRVTRVTVPVYVTVIVALHLFRVFVLHKPITHNLVLVLLLVATVIVLMRPLMALLVRKLAQRAATQKENAALFGEASASVTAEGITVVTEHATAIYRWSMIRDIITTPQNLFLRIGTNIAVVITRDKVTDGNFDAFVAEAQRLRAEATGQKTAILLPAR